MPWYGIYANNQTTLATKCVLSRELCPESRNIGWKVYNSVFRLESWDQCVPGVILSIQGILYQLFEYYRGNINFPSKNYICPIGWIEVREKKNGKGWGCPFLQRKSHQFINS
mgnify:CR=1 FL=1